jgi:predicted nucleotidyltransferase
MRPEEILDERFPDAVGGLVAGSVGRGDDTAGSDVDLLVLTSGPPAPMRSTERVGGRLVEFFVHTEESFSRFVDREVPLRRSPLLHMAADGRVVRDRTGRTAHLQESARARWTAGPPPLHDAECEDRRYRLATLLDDLAEESGSAERAALAATVFTEVADLGLTVRGRWSGRGRWLARRLRAADDALARELVEGLRAALVDDPHPLLGCARAELDRAGGRLDAGYARSGGPP